MNLALVAGTGALPRHLYDAAADPSPLVVALEGHPPQGLDPDMTFRLETLGTLLDTLQDRGVDAVSFAGAITRPSVDPSRIDPATAPLVPRIAAALERGDDGALREVIALFEERGIAVLAAGDIAPDLLPPEGPLTAAEPGDIASDVNRAREAVKAMGAADIGQACVVHRGQVLAVEGAFGTAWMLAGLTARPDGRGGLLYKAPKPGQDRRIDLPAIGADTVAQVKAAGLDGIAIAAGGVLVLDREAAIKAADDAGLWIAVVGPDRT